jgi:hypothetical protein
MKNDLIERYIYAVIRHLPPKARGDVEKELDSLIADMLEERCGEVVPAEKDIRVVLTELGTPEELAAQYCGGERQFLISGTYFLAYKHVLKIVLPIAALAVAFAGILGVSQEWDPQLNPYIFMGKVIGMAFGGAFQGAIQAFAIITIVFAVLERKKVVINEGDMFAKLPPVPQKKAQIKPYEPILGMVLSIFAVVVLLGFPNIIAVRFDDVGWIYVFAAPVIRGLWIPIVLWAIIGIAKETVKLIEGQYTKRLAIVTLIANLFIMISAMVIFLNASIVDSDFIHQFSKTFFESITNVSSGKILFGMFSNINLIFLGIIFFALILDCIIVAVKAWKYDK